MPVVVEPKNPSNALSFKGTIKPCYSFPPILRYSIHLSEISVGSYSHIDIVVSQPLTAACDLGLQAVVSHPLTSIKCVALL